MSITLCNIMMYPIKACAGIELASAELEARGLRYDRRWMVVDEDGVCITQRDAPRMSLIHPSVQNDHLRVEAPEMPPLHVPMTVQTREHFPVRVWNDTVAAVSLGDEAAAWFGAFLGTRCKLVAMTDRSVRPVSSKYALNREVVSFADAFPLLLISEESLADLNRRLDSPVPMRRFRPNLVVKGCAPFAEDTWKHIRIGEIALRVVKPCARCVVTTVDTTTGERGQEPLRTLATFRARGNEVFFGQNLLHAANGVLYVGDEVVIEG